MRLRQPYASLTPRGARYAPRVQISAYLLAADPTWLRSSVTAYYDLVDELVVSYDEDGLGWTGAPVQTDRCLDMLRALDVSSKMRFVGGHFSRPADPLLGDALQRAGAIGACDPAADWVVQLDADELLPDGRALLEAMEMANHNDLTAVEWPLQVLYRRLGPGRYLTVLNDDSSIHYDYGLAIAIRRDARLAGVRGVTGPRLRMAVRGDRRSLHQQHARSEGELRIDSLEPSQAIIHNSWARSPSQLWHKTRSWGHHMPLKGPLYFGLVWYPSPLTWRVLHQVHPFSHGLWPRLGPYDLRAGLLHEEDR